MSNINKFFEELLLFRNLVKKEFPEKEAELLDSLIEQMINVVSRHTDLDISIQNSNSNVSSRGKRSYLGNEMRCLTRKSRRGGKLKKRLSKKSSRIQTRGSVMSNSLSLNKFPSPTCEEMFQLKECFVCLEQLNTTDLKDKVETFPAPFYRRPCSIQLKSLHLNPKIPNSRVSISSTLKEMFQLKECYVHLEQLNDIAMKGKNQNSLLKNDMKPCYVNLKPVHSSPRASVSDYSAIKGDKSLSDTHENNKENHVPRFSEKMDVVNPIEEDKEDPEHSFFRGFEDSFKDIRNQRYYSLISTLTKYATGTESPLKTVNRNHCEKFQEFKIPKKPLKGISHLEVENRRPTEEERPSIYNNRELAIKYGELQNLLNLLNMQKEKLELLDKEIEASLDTSTDDCSLMEEDDAMFDEELTTAEIEECSKWGTEIFLEIQSRIPNKIKKLFCNPQNKEVTIEEIVKMF